MPIVFECLECNTITEVDDDLAGKTIRCRECHSFGRVPIPPPKKKPREIAPPPPVPIFTYHCPFCQSTNRPVWKLYWTPMSTLAWLAVWPIVLGPAWGFCAVLLAWSGVGHEAAWIVVGIGAALFAALAVTQYLLANSRFIKEERQVCPDCGVRLS
jgi:DNA-directed RNA polymerase subunit RPC12/RpoP